MGAAWLEVALDGVEDTARRAIDDLHRVLEQLAEIREAGRADRSAADVARMTATQGRERRLAADASFAAYQQANAALRMALVKAMVDEDRLSFTDAGALLGVSRTMASRLYRGVYADGKQIGPKEASREGAGQFAEG